MRRVEINIKDGKTGEVFKYETHSSVEIWCYTILAVFFVLAAVARMLLRDYGSSLSALLISAYMAIRVRDLKKENKLISIVDGLLSAIQDVKSEEEGGGDES